MGCCNDHIRSESEDFIRQFYESLPIRKADSTEVSEFIIELISKKEEETKERKELNNIRVEIEKKYSIKFKGEDLLSELKDFSNGIYNDPYSNKHAKHEDKKDNLEDKDNTVVDAQELKSNNPEEFEKLRSTLITLGKALKISNFTKPEVNEEIIKQVQEKYFNSSLEEFSSVKILEEYYSYNPTKYILWGVLLICGYNLVKFKSASCKLLDAIGEPSQEVFCINYKTSQEYINALLKPSIDMISRFTVEILNQRCSKVPINFKKDLTKPFCTTIQDELIKKIVEIDQEGKVNFIELLKEIDNFMDCNLRDNLVEIYNVRPYSQDKYLGFEGDVRVKETKEQNILDKKNYEQRLINNMKLIEEEANRELAKRNLEKQEIELNMNGDKNKQS